MMNLTVMKMHIIRNNHFKIALLLYFASIGLCSYADGELTVKGNGYYRVKNVSMGDKGYLDVVGNYTPEGFPTSNRDLTGVVNFSTLDHTNAGEVVYLSATFNNKTNTFSSGTQIGSGTNMGSQGVFTKDLTGFTFNFNHGTAQGYYTMTYISFIWKFSLKNDASGHVYVGRLSSTPAYSDWLFEPIDDGDNYFGVTASDKMSYDGGYWTSAYFSFPYQLLDGQEAYYVSAIKTNGDKKTVTLTKINGKIPAATGVLLKCKNTTASQNRLMPLDPSTTDVATISNNLLKGTYQLKTKDGTQDTFDGSSMRVFSVKDGVVGFYKLTEGKALAANKAYLSSAELANAKSISFEIEDKTTGISEILPEIENQRQQDNSYYNLMGRKVEHPSKGIYIHHGKKVLIK